MDTGSDFKELREELSSLPDDELARIAKATTEDYRPEAIACAREILRDRGRDPDEFSDGQVTDAAPAAPPAPASQAARAASPRIRPVLVWVICLFYVVTSGWTLLRLELIYLKLYPVSEEQLTILRGQPIADVLMGVAFSVLLLVAANMLWLLRREAFNLFVAAFILALGNTVRGFMPGGPLAKLMAQNSPMPVFAIVSAVLGNGIFLATCAYAWKLRQRGLLGGAGAPMPEKPERTALVRPSAMRAVEIGAVLLATVARSIAYAFLPHSTWQFSVSQMTWDLPRQIGMSALLIILLADRRWHSLRGKLWAGPWSHQVALAGLLVVGGEVLRHTVGIVLTVVGVPSGPPSGSEFASPAAYALYPAFELASVLYQETLYRAYLLDRLAPWTGDAGAVILSAVCFAAVHGYPPIETGILFATGVLYGVAYLKMRSLPALMAAHWIHNWIWWAGQARP